MYAIVEDGGKQYRVEPGQTLFLELHNLSEGTPTLTLDRVLMIGGETCRIGQPLVPGARVTARVVGEVKAPKLFITKFRRRKGYRLRQGHRQRHLKVTIDAIEG